MTKTYIGKVAKVLNGLPHFAEVEICIENGNGNILCRCTGSGFHGQGVVEDAPDNGYDDWKESAIDGVKIGFRMAGQKFNDNTIVITRISGLDGTDTNPDTVKCAAIFAAWNYHSYNPTENDSVEIVGILKKSWDKFRIA